VSRYIPDTASALSLAAAGSGTSGRIAADLGDLAANVTAVAAGIGTLVIATLNLKLIILLAVAHPLLAVIAGIGTIAGYLGLGAGVGLAVEGAVRNHEFNLVSRTLLHLGLSEAGFEKMLAQGRDTARADLTRSIADSLAAVRAGGMAGIVEAASETFDAMVAQAIADLGVLEQIARVADSGVQS
jgi:hypothetical protein